MVSSSAGRPAPAVARRKERCGTGRVFPGPVNEQLGLIPHFFFTAYLLQVLAVGKGAISSNGERIPMEIRAGDFVKFREFAGDSFRIKGREYIVLRASDCLAKWK